MNIWSIFDLAGPLCPVCGLLTRQAGTLCPGCDRDLPRLSGTGPIVIPGIDSTLFACAYAHPVDRLVQQLKFGGRLPLARTLGSLLAAAARTQNTTLPAALVPVPLHAARQRQRGFNQAEAIAAQLGLPIPVITHTVRRCRDTQAQSGLDLDARRRNLHAAFAVAGHLPSHTAIVDDVVTTGSTVQALAGALRAHGVERVDVWAIARAL